MKFPTSRKFPTG